MVPFTNKESQTIDYYDKNAEAWATAHGGPWGSYWKNELRKFHQLLPSGKVLEIGSGGGRDAAALITLGYDYIGTDVSKSLIKVAKKRNPQASFEHVAVHDLDFPKHSFDGFWTAATLLHIPKDKIDGALQRIKTQVKPGGIGFISVKAGAGEREDPETGRWFVYYSQKGFREILEKNDYKIIEEETRKGENAWWLVYYIKVAAGA